MKSRFILADHLVVFQYYGEKHLINIVLLLPIIVIEFWDFNLHVFFFHCTFLCVYLLYDCSGHDDYMFYHSKLFQIIDDVQSLYIFVCGDFNANIKSPSQFGDDLLQLCSDNSLCLADALFLPRNTFTFISSSHDTVSWLDHILTTTSRYSLFTDICVKSDFITSDHLPLCFTISVDNLYVPISSSANNIPCDALRYNGYGASD